MGVHLGPLSSRGQPGAPSVCRQHAGCWRERVRSWPLAGEAGSASHSLLPLLGGEEPRQPPLIWSRCGDRTRDRHGVLTELTQLGGQRERGTVRFSARSLLIWRKVGPWEVWLEKAVALQPGLQGSVLFPHCLVDSSRPLCKRVAVILPICRAASVPHPLTLRPGSAKSRYRERSQRQGGPARDPWGKVVVIPRILVNPRRAWLRAGITWCVRQGDDDPIMGQGYRRLTDSNSARDFLLPRFLSGPGFPTLFPLPSSV